MYASMLATLNVVKFEGVESFEVEVAAIRPYRDSITIIEFSSEGDTPTGRSWTERFDSENGDVNELITRFKNRIKSGFPQADFKKPEDEEYMAALIEATVEKAVQRMALIQKEKALGTRIKRLFRRR